MEERTVTATCLREMNINANPYNIRFTLDPSRKPTDIWCGCISGSQGKCKHVAALVQVINAERTTSQTDEAKTWLAPSELVQCRYPKGETVQELVTGEKPQQRSFRPPQEDLDHLADLLKKHNLTSASAYKSITVEKGHVEAPPEPITIHLRISQMLQQPLDTISSEDSRIRDILATLDPTDRDFYEGHVVIQPGDDEKIFKETMGQSTGFNRDAWHAARKVRITASKAHKIVRGRREATRIKYIYKPTPEARPLEKVKWVGVKFVADFRQSEHFNGAA